MPTYTQLDADLQARETDVAKFWEEAGIFAKSLAQNAGGPRWVFS